MNDQEKFPSRREFGKMLGVAAVVPLAAAADEKDKPAAPDPFAASVESLLEIVKARYGKWVFSKSSG